MCVREIYRESEGVSESKREQETEREREGGRVRARLGHSLGDVHSSTTRLGPSDRGPVKASDSGQMR